MTHYSHIVLLLATEEHIITMEVLISAYLLWNKDTIIARVLNGKFHSGR